jgi:amino acid permease
LILWRVWCTDRSSASGCLLYAGWMGGIITLLVFFAITLWSSLLLTECHETGGQKHPTYRSAVLHVLGKAVAVCSHCLLACCSTHTIVYT